MYTKEEVAKFLKESVEWLISVDMGCTCLELDDRLGICVGWLPGYGEELRDDCIQSKEEPDYAINAGIKVYTSDDMRTDYEFINMPYYENGDVVMTDVSIEPDEDYDKLAGYFLKEYEGLKDLEIDEHGLIKDDSKIEAPADYMDEFEDDMKRLSDMQDELGESVKEDVNGFKTLANELSDHMSKLGAYYEIWPEENGISIEISWGDWKHDHLWCDYEVKNFLKSKGHEVASHDTEITDEDGSDTYSAIHSYVIK